MKSIKNLAIAMLTIIVVGSCTVVNSGVTHETEVGQLNTATSMRAFDGVDVSGSMDVVVTQGDQPSVIVKGDNREAFEHLTIYVEDHTLHIATKKESAGIFGGVSYEGLTIYVTTPMVKSIDLAGSGTVTTRGAITAEEVEVELAGSGEITIADALTCHELSVELAGSGNIVINSLKAESVETEIAGSGNVTCDGMDVAEAESQIAGSGIIVLKGKVGRHNEKVAGSGRVDTSGITRQ